MSRVWTPRPYQGLSLDFMLERERSGLLARMGMGKTVSAATALSAWQLLDGQPALVLAPKRVALGTWPDEFTKWEHLANLPVSAINGTPAQRQRALQRDAAVYTMAYDNLPWLREALGGRWPFTTIIADESTRLKGFRGGYRRHPKSGKVYYAGAGGQRSRVLGEIAHTRARRFVALTGTPSPNGLQDLWGQIWFLDGGKRLGASFSAFQDRWFQVVPGGEGYTQLRPLAHAQGEIQALIQDLCLALDPKDWFDLREPVVSPVYVELPAEARRAYERMERELFVEIDGRSAEALSAGARSQKLLQLASGAVYVDPLADSDRHPRSKEWREVHDAKVQALASIIEEAGGEPVLVAYWFRSDLARLQRAFPKARVLDDDPQTVRDWNAGRIPVLLAHPQSAGHGLNLQDGGRILAIFSHDWNLEYYEQIVERIGPVRQLQSGHDRSVLLYPIVARGTIDEVVMRRRETKADVQKLLMDYLKGRA